MAMNSSGFKGIVTPQMSAGGLAPSGPPTGAIPTSIGVPPKRPAAPPPVASPPAAAAPPIGALNAAAGPAPGPSGAPPQGNPVAILQKCAEDAANACGRLVTAMKVLAGPNAPAVEQAAANLRTALMAVVQAGQPKGGMPPQ